MNEETFRRLQETMTNLAWEWITLKIETDDLNPITVNAINEYIQEMREAFFGDMARKNKK